MDALPPTCQRCGFEILPDPPHLEASPLEGLSEEAWPAGLPLPPPLPPWANPHPPGQCCSPFSMGQTLYWDLGGRFPDLQPATVVFLGLTEIQGPFFYLEEGAWIQDAPAQPTSATVELHALCSLGNLLRDRGETLGTVEVPLEQLATPLQWPTWGDEAGPGPG